MGLFSSKPAAPVVPKFTPDLSRANISVDELGRQLSAAQAQAANAVTTTATNVKTRLMAWYTPVLWTLGFVAFVCIIIVIYDTFAPPSWPNFFFARSSPTSAPAPPAAPAAPAAPGAPAAPAPDKPGVGETASPPPLLSKLYSSVFGNSSGNLAPSFHDATTSTTIRGNLAPLSAERDGGYGMQWWMYVKDWNYGYGKSKTVVKRPDSTNGSIANPHISLHPTDNSLEISVSVYPATEGGSGKAEPAPAGHSGSTDDVFVCSVPNIPLQTWFSVSVTVFGRNLDVYIDGKLVKSCFLSGVPKPAVGDIQLTPDGGFSGRICQFYHYPKMLTPSDALTFWSAGTSCRNQTATGKSSATGYSVKFGVYDSIGKEVQEYTF